MTPVKRFALINILHELLKNRKTLLSLCAVKKETCPAFDESLYKDYS